jgi:hypothetical protein
MRKAALVLWMLVACGGDGPGGEATTVTYGEFCGIYSRAMCDGLRDCSAEVPADCEAQLADACCTGATCQTELAISDGLEECLTEVFDDWNCQDALDYTVCAD